MNNSLIKFGTAAALAIGLLVQTMLPASAGEVENRIGTQEHRLHAGVADGQISPRQAARDQRRINHVQRERNRDLVRNGGTLTRHQYHQLNHQLNHNSNHIYDQRR